MVNTMREMKDSGIPWIGEINTKVTMVPVKYLLEAGKNSVKVGPFGSQLSGADLQNEDTEYWVYNQRSVIDRNSSSGTAFVTEEKFNSMVGFQVQSNDILITTRGTIGKIFRISKEFHKGIIHPCIIKFRINDNLYDYELLELIFNNSDIISRQLLYESNSTTIEVIYSDTLKSIKVPCWEMPLQKKIRDYLKAKCTEIDALSSDIQSEIDTLQAYKRSVIAETVTNGLDKNVPMKGSGVDWIGDIPSNWSVSKLGNVLTLRNERNNKPLEEVNLISLYTDRGVVQHADLEKTSGNIAQNADGYKIVHKNDIVVNIILAWMGAMGISDYDGVTSPAYDVYKIKMDKIFPHYCHYILRSPAMAGECYRYGRGIMMMRWRTYSTEFKKIKIPLPPIEEQKKISDFLDEKCKEIDYVILQKQEQLEVLLNYKKSLIYEYVTGKKEVSAS